MTNAFLTLGEEFDLIEHRLDLPIESQVLCPTCKKIMKEIDREYLAPESKLDVVTYLCSTCLFEISRVEDRKGL